MCRLIVWLFHWARFQESSLLLQVPSLSCWVISHCMDTFVSPFASWRTSGFSQFLAIMNTAAIDIHTQVRGQTRTCSHLFLDRFLRMGFCWLILNIHGGAKWYLILGLSRPLVPSIFLLLICHSCIFGKVSCFQDPMFGDSLEELTRLRVSYAHSSGSFQWKDAWQDYRGRKDTSRRVGETGWRLPIFSSRSGGCTACSVSARGSLSETLNPRGFIVG